MNPTTLNEANRLGWIPQRVIADFQLHNQGDTQVKPKPKNLPPMDQTIGRIGVSTCLNPNRFTKLTRATLARRNRNEQMGEEQIW
jgi:hypothetical protein